MYKSIVVGTDGSPTAGHAVDAAVGLAERFDATLHVVSAYWTNPDVVTNAATAGSPHFVVTQSEQQVDRVKRMLTATADELRRRGLRVETYASPGSPADAIVNVAEAQDADLIVIGNRGMTGARRFLGSVPNSVSHRAPCSVLIVKTT